MLYTGPASLLFLDSCLSSLSPFLTFPCSSVLLPVISYYIAFLEFLYFCISGSLPASPNLLPNSTFNRSEISFRFPPALSLLISLLRVLFQLLYVFSLFYFQSPNIELISPWFCDSYFVFSFSELTFLS